MVLDNFIIKAIDKNNITFAEYREMESPRTKEKTMQWVESGQYYAKLSSCLTAIKEYIIKKYYTNLNDFNEVLSKIEQLNGCIIKCDLKALESDLGGE